MDCIFCKIINGEIPSYKVYEDEDFYSFLDINPAVEGHLLIVPKIHYDNIIEMPEELLKKVIVLTKKMGKMVMKSFNAKGFNVVQNNGRVAGQTVDHFHIHIIPRYSDDNAKFGWNEKSLREEKACELLGKIKY